MSAHTPGPWEEAGGWIFAGEQSVSEYAGCGTHEAAWNPADLALVLAAPELLDALRKCVAELEIIKGAVHDERMALIAGHAAIAKATSP